MAAHPEYGLVPDYFEWQCRALDLPIDTILDDTAGFVDAIVGLLNPADRVKMRLLIEKWNQLRSYLHASVCTIWDAWLVSNEVLEGIVRLWIPGSYRTSRQ